jgi:hypothetical protein
MEGWVAACTRRSLEMRRSQLWIRFRRRHSRARRNLAPVCLRVRSQEELASIRWETIDGRPFERRDMP